MVSKAEYWKDPEKYRALANAERLRRMEVEPDLLRKEKREWAKKKRSTPEGAQNHRDGVKKYRDANKEKCQAKTRKWGQADGRRWMILNAKYRAQRKGVPFDIKLEDITIPTECPVLGIPIKCYTTGTRGFRDDSCTLDRIVPSKGYVPGNIMVISSLANSLKRAETSPDNLRKVADYIEREFARVYRELGP